MKYLILVGFAVLALIANPFFAASAENCSTALSRIARRAVENLIVKHRGDACSGAKIGPLAVDKTRQVELRDFRLCEDGAVVAASVTVNVECVTSDRAVVQTSISDNITAIASANLDTCQVIDASISAGKRQINAILSLAGASRALRDGAIKEIKPYCK